MIKFGNVAFSYCWESTLNDPHVAMYCIFWKFHNHLNFSPQNVFFTVFYLSSLWIKIPKFLQEKCLKYEKFHWFPWVPRMRIIKNDIIFLLYAEAHTRSRVLVMEMEKDTITFVRTSTLWFVLYCEPHFSLKSIVILMP